jgi:hypothetical protein
MGVSRMELVAHIYHKTPKTEPEIYETLSEKETMVLFGVSPMSATLVPSTGGSRFQPSPTLREFASLITQETKRLDALQRYLNSRWSYAESRPCSAASAKAFINWLLEFQATRSNAQSRRHWNYSNTATENPPIENHTVFCNSSIIGIAHGLVSQKTQDGLWVVPCRAEERFGAALLVECEVADCTQHRFDFCKRFHSYRIVTTAFVFERELDDYED